MSEGENTEEFQEDDVFGDDHEHDYQLANYEKLWSQERNDFVGHELVWACACGDLKVFSYEEAE